MDPLALLPVLVKVFGVAKAGKALVSAHTAKKGALELLSASGQLAESIAAARKFPAPTAVDLLFAVLTRSFAAAVNDAWEEAPGGAVLPLSKDEEADLARRHALASKRMLELLEGLAAGEPSALVDPVGQAFTRLHEAYGVPGSLDPDAVDGPFYDRVSSIPRSSLRDRFVLAFARQGGPNVALTVARDYDPARRAALRRLLLATQASWRDRHVFGLGRAEEHDATTGLPFLPLGSVYVEPDARGTRTPVRSATPVLATIDEALLGRARRTVVVTADFGSGKTLTARVLASQKSRAALLVGDEATRFPLFVRAPAHAGALAAGDLERLVREGLAQLAASAGQSLAEGDPQWIVAPGVLLVIDALDEVRLDERELDGLLDALSAQVRDRAVVFARPGSLPRALPPGMERLLLLRFDEARESEGNELTPQIDKWLSQWNTAARIGRAPILREDLEARELLREASTPLLLLLLAVTWDDQTEVLTRADLFERFVAHVAQGKFHDDERQPTVRAAAAAAADGPLGEVSAGEAFCRLLAEVAFRLHGSEQRGEPFRQRALRAFLRERWDEAATERILPGLLLSVQVDAKDHDGEVLFAHRSFAEYLTARHVATRLLAAAERGASPDDLLGTRLVPRGAMFELLVEIVKRSRSPEAQRALGACFLAEVNDVSQRFLGSGNAIADDVRAPLRELLLGLACALPGKTVVREAALRSLLAWATARGTTLSLSAPGADLSGLSLEGARLLGANLAGASLEGASLAFATLDGADLRDVRARGVRLDQARMRRADLGGGDFTDASFRGTDLAGAEAEGASFAGAVLVRVLLGDDVDKTLAEAAGRTAEEDPP